MKEIKQEICRIMKKAHDMGMITSRDGNLSYRMGNKFYITPSGVKKNCMDAADIVEGEIRDGKIVLLDDKKPSGEFAMHKLLHELESSLNDEAQAVLHLHPTYTIAAAYRGIDILKLCNDFPEITRYTKVGPTVEKLPICSDILAQKTKDFMTQYGTNLTSSIVVQMNHGVTAVGETPSHAFEHVERLEHICKIALVSGL
jgi:L-fuculose-phosphate aldolase